jgi:hypothetical protein
VLVLALPDASAAQRVQQRRQFGSVQQRQHSGTGHPGSHRFHHHHRGHVPQSVIFYPPFFTTSTLYTPPPVYYAPPPPVYYYPPPQAYAPAPAYAPPPAPVAPPPASQDVQPIQREVVFSSGRWVLQGDGVAVPYKWVWIPNPPSAPPPGASPSGRESSREIYAWTDRDGVTTYTDRLAKVPPEYRGTARREP